MSWFTDQKAKLEAPIRSGYIDTITEASGGLIDKEAAGWIYDHKPDKAVNDALFTWIFGDKKASVECAYDYAKSNWYKYFGSIEDCEWGDKSKRNCDEGLGALKVEEAWGAGLFKEIWDCTKWVFQNQTASTPFYPYIKDNYKDPTQILDSFEIGTPYPKKGGGCFKPADGLLHALLYLDATDSKSYPTTAYDMCVKIFQNNLKHNAKTVLDSPYSKGNPTGRLVYQLATKNITDPSLIKEALVKAAAAQGSKSNTTLGIQTEWFWYLIGVLSFLIILGATKLFGKKKPNKAEKPPKNDSKED